MADPRTRERIVDLIRKMKENTTDRGCTPGEAAKFAAKVAEWIEKYQIDEAELRLAKGEGSGPDIEVCQKTLGTGKKTFDPGMTSVVSGLATAVCCRVILLRRSGEATYGIIGDVLDADYICQIAAIIVPELKFKARMEGAELGRKKGALVRWTNNYLVGASFEIRNRIERERHDRSETKRNEVEEIERRLSGLQEKEGADNAAPPCAALTVVTGETIAAAKRTAVEDAFKDMYPRIRKAPPSRSDHDYTAISRGRKAGATIGLHVGVEQK